MYGQICLTEFIRTFFASFFPSLFYLSQGEYTPRKNPGGTQSMKIQVKPGEIPVRKNVGKNMQNVDLQLNRQDVKLLANVQKLIIINKGKDLKISKNRFNRFGGQAGSRTSEKIISIVWIVRKFDIGHLGFWTSLVQHFGSLKFLDK